MSKMNQKPDRRIRKTKDQLQKALFQIMQEKDIQDITVRELAETADINRGTFYLHYRDVYDMLSHIEDNLFQKFSSILDENMSRTQEPSASRTLTDLFFFIDENRDFCRILLGPHGDYSFTGRLMELFRTHFSTLWEKKQQSPESFDYCYSFITAGCMGLIETWLKRDDPEPPAEMAKTAETLILLGLHTNNASTV